MPPVKRYIRKCSGWLAIPASLFLMVACQTTDQSPDTAITAHHTLAVSEDDGSPLAQVFTGEADVIVLTFFDLYCVACQQSAQNFNKLASELEASQGDIDVQITGVGIGDTDFELKVFQRKYELTYPCLADPDKSFEEPFAVRGTPTVLAFRRQGNDCLEFYRHEGRFRESNMENLITEIIRHDLNP